MTASYNGMLLEKFSEKKWVQSINKFFESNLFIAIFAMLVVICNVFGLEFFVYTLVISYGVYLCLLGRDMRSVAAAVPFMYLSPSVQNNPAANPDSIFNFGGGFVFIIAYLMVFIILLILRIIANKKRGLFMQVKWKLFLGFIALSLALLCNGIGQAEYTIMNLVYSAILIISLALMYFLLILLVDWKTVRKDYFAWIAMFMGFIVALELINVYVQGGVIGDGKLNAAKIFTGWGVSTNMAGVLICAIPAAFYLSVVKEKPLIYIILATIIYLAAIFTTSRNGVLVGGLTFVASAIIALKPKKDRKKKIIMYLSIAGFVLVIALVFWKVSLEVLEHLLTAGVLDFQRFGIYGEGLKQFISAPIFGKGFFACNAFAWGTEKLTVIPPRWHCTIVQMLASCGGIGAIAYGFHRYQTVKLFWKKPTMQKLFISLSIMALLVSSLFDCFLFNIGPGLFYSVMLAFLEKAEENVGGEIARETKRADYQYIEHDNENFFTVVLLPKDGEKEAQSENQGKYPTVIFRSPYVDCSLEKTEESFVEEYENAFASWLERGYAVVFQHCRGQGKSTGAFVPYVQEREDGLALLDWIRKQDFYNGELFLVGASYTASLHYTIAPFDEDIKGCVFEVQDSERYRLWYRNGQMRKGHANWHFGLYKRKCGLEKSFHMQSFSLLPLADLSQKVLGDRAEDFEQMLFAQDPCHEFWTTRFGGIEAKNALNHANIPVLLTTGYNDFYIGGVFQMWRELNEETRLKSAFLVSPYNHGDGYDLGRGLAFENGKRSEAFGGNYAIDWIEHIRKGADLPFEKGVITYYRTFENKWASDLEAIETQDLKMPLGEEVRSFVYDPLQPPAFACEGLLVEEEERANVLTIFTPPMEKDIFIKGKMRATLKVASDCPDTSFYMRVSIQKGERAYVLRHDITSLCYQLGTYQENEMVDLQFTFDEYAFLLKQGESLRIDIASTDDNSYVCHTNQKGEYAMQTETRTAINTVDLKESYLLLPVEESECV